MLQHTVLLVLLATLSLDVCLGHRQTNNEGKTWVFLAAGSNEYYNYRHQADICHAYQIAKAHDIPDENIIVMMYDDIAHNPQNPTPGVIINKPGGDDVYKGVPKDYTGKHVTPENFLNILKGDDKKMAGIGSGRVINSSDGDHIFVFFSDHGSNGVLGFVDEELHVADLQKTLREMSESNKFEKLVIFVEACHAGSMFDDVLPDDSNIFVLTASDPYESSYACYYSDKHDTFLGDAFAVHWMEFVDVDNETYSMHHLFSKVRTGVKDSHVEEYGNLDIGTEEVFQFLSGYSGPKAENVAPVIGMPYNKQLRNTRQRTEHSHEFHKRNKDLSAEIDTVPSLEVPLTILRRKLKKATTNEERKKYQDQIVTAIHRRQMVDRIVEDIMLEIVDNDSDQLVQMRARIVPRINKQNMHCAKVVTKEFSDKCFKIAKNPYVNSKIADLVRTCNIESLDQQKVLKAINNACDGIGVHTGII